MNISELAVYVKHALESQEKSLLQTTCGIISDLANSMKSGINEYLGDFVPCLKRLLETDDVDRVTKLPALHALGCLSLNSGAYFNDHYLQDFLGILSGAAQMSVDEALNQSDAETRMYLEELRNEILEDYTAVLVSISDIDDLDEDLPEPERKSRMQRQYVQKQLFEAHLPTICNFLQRTQAIHAMKEHSEEENRDFLEKTAGLILDISTQYFDQHNVKQALS